MTIGDKIFTEGDWISLDASNGIIYEGRIATIFPMLSDDFGKIMELADKYGTIDVRTNSETARDSKIAYDFGAKGIGLFRTEHMFFEGERLKYMRKIIFANDEKGRREALDKLVPIQRQDFKDVFCQMANFPVAVRLLDPPFNEFIPYEETNQKELAIEIGCALETIKEKVNELLEYNPMMGHRGCRLANTYPEITEMQVRAIIEAAIDLKKEGIDIYPEIMIPLISTAKEMKMQEELIRSIAHRVFCEKGIKIEYLVGAMIETPRAALIANEVAKVAEFFSFAPNDFTQMIFGYSRDDIGKFLPIYLKKGILKNDPFEILDQDGVGEFIKIGIQKGRSTNNNLKIGICGHHAGEPSSIEFCVRAGMDYVSCEPFRVPIARLAVAQASIKNVLI